MPGKCNLIVFRASGSPLCQNFIAMHYANIILRRICKIVMLPLLLMIFYDRNKYSSCKMKKKRKFVY
jgi:uncharacterized protein YqhQ